MNTISKGYIKKVILDFNKIDEIVERHYDSITDSMSLLESRNVFIRMKREIGEVIDRYRKHESGGT